MHVCERISSAAGHACMHALLQVGNFGHACCLLADLPVNSYHGMIAVESRACTRIQSHECSSWRCTIDHPKNLPMHLLCFMNHVYNHHCRGLSLGCLCMTGARGKQGDVHLGFTALVALQVGLLQHSLTESLIIQVMVSSQQLRNQIPEVVHEVFIQRLCWEASAADAYCL